MHSSFSLPPSRSRSLSRVNGTLAVARAMGDFSFKKEKKMSPEEQQVTCNPEIRKFTSEPTDEFIILACGRHLEKSCLSVLICIYVYMYIRLSIFMYV